MTGLSEKWKKSARSNGSDACVEVRRQGQAVEVRDTKDRIGPTLTFSPAAWNQFMHDIREGQHAAR